MQSDPEVPEFLSGRNYEDEESIPRLSSELPEAVRADFRKTVEWSVGDTQRQAWEVLKPRVEAAYWDEYAVYVRSYVCLGVPQQDWTPLKARFFEQVF